MALVLNSAPQLKSWALLLTALFRCISMSWMSVNLLSVDAVKTLLCSLVVSHLDYCNSLLVGLPRYLIKRLQEVQNAAAISILRTPTSEHISPRLQNRTFTGCLSIGEPYTRLLHYVILHFLAVALNTCLILLMFTPLLDPCALPQILASWALPMST